MHQSKVSSNLGKHQFEKETKKSKVICRLSRLISCFNIALYSLLSFVIFLFLLCPPRTLVISSINLWTALLKSVLVLGPYNWGRFLKTENLTSFRFTPSLVFALCAIAGICCLAFYYQSILLLYAALTSLYLYIRHR